MYGSANSTLEFGWFRGTRMAWVAVWGCAVLSLLLLWARLLAHVSREWSLNPQYSYGAAVPFLCLYLLYLEAKERRYPDSPRFRWFGWVAVAGAVAYPPVRLLQEANPEWRFVGWALALITLAVTYVVLRAAAARYRLIPETILFPLGFFLVSIPWPTFVENPLIQGLTRFNAFCTVELMNLGGVPAIQHGNTIELSTGSVGINEACSGIRSFQASLMISLFLGHLYRFSPPLRMVLCVAGFALAIAFNICRTTVLSWVAAKKGIGTIAQWHDPTGVLILLLCFVTLWLLSDCIARRHRPTAKPEAHSLTAPPRSTTHPNAAAGSAWFAVSLLPWLLVSELGVHAWYSTGESETKPRVWTVVLPEHSDGYQEVPFSQEARRMLRFDSGRNAKWNDFTGRWQAIFLQWNPGAVAVHLAKNHTPETCLAASGRKIREHSDVETLSVDGLEFPVQFYHMNDGHMPLHVLYCLWDDRPAGKRSFSAMSLNLSSRLRPVLERQRNLGQRSLELALWAPLDNRAARTALIRSFMERVKPELTLPQR